MKSPSSRLAHSGLIVDSTAEARVAVTGARPWVPESGI
jgi:hypothetical protein